MARATKQPAPEELVEEVEAEVVEELPEEPEPGDDANEVVDVEPEEIPEEIAASTDVVVHERETLPAPASALPSPVEWEASLAIARQIAGTTFVPKDYRGQPEAVVAAILAGRELGIGPMQALREIHMIDGRATFSANLMLAQMRKGGIQIMSSESTRERAWIRAKRQDTGEEISVEWTIEEARGITQKGKPLTEKDNWKNYPADMLWARAVGRLARRLGSDLMAGLVYSAEEMKDLEEGAYGVGTGYEATTAAPPREFDPAVDILPGAVSGEGFMQALAQQLGRIDGDAAWGAVIDDLAEQYAGAAGVDLAAPGWRGLPEKERTTFWRRMANAAAKVRDGDLESFPPPEDAEIEAAFDWAFPGLVLNLDVVDPQQAELDAEATAAVAADGPDESDSAEDAPLDGDAVDAALAAEPDTIPFGEEEKP